MSRFAGLYVPNSPVVLVVFLVVLGRLPLA